MQINGMLECSVLGFPPSLQAREAAQRQIPSTSFHGYFQSSHEGPEPPATSSVVQGKQGAISRDDSCGGLQPFHPPSPSPLMTASLEWVGSYFWGHGEGLKLSGMNPGWQEARLLLQQGKSALLRQEDSVQAGIHLAVTCFFLHGINVSLFLSAVTP